MTQQEQYWKELAESYLKIIKEINHQCGTANPSSFNQIKDAVASAIELSDEVINKESAPLAPAQGVEEADEYFYCKEWNNIGYMCEEQCDRCKKTENFTLDDPKVIKEAQSQALKYSEQYSEDRRISKKSSFIVGFIAGSRWQQGQQPTPTIGARWVKASEAKPKEGWHNGKYGGDECVIDVNNGNLIITFPNGRINDNPDMSITEYLEESTCNFPTRDQAEEWSHETWHRKVDYHGLADIKKTTAIAMYDWIIEQIKISNEK